MRCLPAHFGHRFSPAVCGGGSAARQIAQILPLSRIRTVEARSPPMGAIIANKRRKISTDSCRHFGVLHHRRCGRSQAASGTNAAKQAGSLMRPVESWTDVSSEESPIDPLRVRISMSRQCVMSISFTPTPFTGIKRRKSVLPLALLQEEEILFSCRSKSGVER
jgi:hypothetical protein